MMGMFQMLLFFKNKKTKNGTLIKCMCLWESVKYWEGVEVETSPYFFSSI